MNQCCRTGKQEKINLFFVYFIFDSQLIVWSKYYKVISKTLVVMNCCFYSTYLYFREGGVDMEC